MDEFFMNTLDAGCVTMDQITSQQKIEYPTEKQNAGNRSQESEYHLLFPVSCLLLFLSS